MSALHGIAELLFFQDFIDRNSPKNFWWCVAVSFRYHGLRLMGRAMSAETDAHAEARLVEDT